jgi:hypothetical protein
MDGKPAFVANVIGNAIESGRNLTFKPFTPWASELPVLIGEGTGMFQTYGVTSDPIAEERANVYKMPSLGFAKKTIVHKPMAASGKKKTALFFCFYSQSNTTRVFCRIHGRVHQLLV